MLEIKCLACGGEDFYIVRGQGGVFDSIYCEGCGAESRAPEEETSPEGDIRPGNVLPGLYEEVHEEKKGRGHVYFAAASEENYPIKIGHTTNSVASRLEALQTGNPAKLSALAHIGGDLSTERAFHHLFQASRIGGEWFKRSPEIMAVISALNIVVKQWPR